MAFVALLMPTIARAAADGRVPRHVARPAVLSGADGEDQSQVTEALRAVVSGVGRRTATQEHLNIDETGTKEENGKAWLWTFVARAFTVFAVRTTREATALGVFLTEKFQGVVTCDRAKMYWQVGRLQWCWAHLKRDFQAMIDSGDKRAKWLGERLRAAHVRIVRALGRLSAWQDLAGGAGASDGFGTPKGGTLAAARHPMWSCRHSRHVSRIVRTSALVVDVFATRRGRADQQCGRASVASCGDLAEAVVRARRSAAGSRFVETC